MKKLLTLLFAAGLAVSLSSVSFAQDTAAGDQMEKKEMMKQEDGKEKKEMTKKDGDKEKEKVVKKETGNNRM
jgi:pentapeptide MXKDX repeat protein